MPIRVRLALLFTGVLACLLASVGVYAYTRLVADLNAIIDQGQRARATQLVSLARAGTPFLGTAQSARLLDANESFAEIVDRDGRVLDASAILNAKAVLNPADRRRAARGTITVTQGVRGLDERMQILATPLRYGSQEAVGLVGVGLGDRNEAIGNLRDELLLAAPFALVIAALAAYAFAAAALRPVETMRKRAATLGAELAGERLPIPRARDELSRLGETLNDLIARLEGTLERERRFAADASHELRTPLALLKTEIELALDDDVPREDLVAALRSAGAETEKLIRLANDLLVLARSDASSFAVAPEPVRAKPLIDRIAHRFEPRATAARRTIRTDVDDALTITVDPQRIEQALTNLIDNALEHGDGTVTVRAVQTDHAIELHVVDTGTGVDDDELDHLFERFHRGRRARTRGGGAGLGLSVVEAIARSHGGSVQTERTAAGFDVCIRLEL